MNRFKEMLFVHWKAVRWILVPFVLLCFGMPMLMLRIIQEVPGNTVPNAAAFLYYQKSYVVLFPYLAFLAGGAIALTAWSWDHQSRHVYALSLPISRARYSLTKFLAGVAIIGIPVAALLIGTLLGLGLTKIPTELHSYPFSFTARFTLAALIAYSLVFSLASSTVKTTVSIIVAFIVVFVFGSFLVEYLNQATGRHLVSPADLLEAAFTLWPGPLSVFGGNWALIDV